jgi:predicted esterase
MNFFSINRSFYTLSIFFAVILTALTFFESIVRFQLGPQTFGLDSYPLWFLVVNAVMLVASLFLLVYYRLKKYNVSFFAGLVDLVVTICFGVVIYSLLTDGVLRNYYTPAFMAMIVTGIVYGGSLAFSASGKRPWLKTAGVSIFILKLILGAIFIWGMISQNVNRFETTEKIVQWFSFAGSLVLTLFVLNFLTELKTLKKENPKLTRQSAIETGFGVVGLVAIVLAVLIGGKLSTEKYWLLNWINRGPENARKLAEPFDARTYVNNKGDTLRYRLLTPLNYDSAKKYPLAVCLHGGGGRGTDNILQVEGSWTAQLLSEQQNRQKYPAFVFVPQCPPASSWGGIPNWPVVDSIVFEAMTELEKEFAIDETRRYVMGESLGGYGSWHFITMHPHLFAAAVPICGGGDPALAGTIAEIPVWAFHGAKDRNVPVRLSREMIDAMKKAGGNPKYTEYPDEGHIISKQVTATPDLLDWIFEQRRD